MSPKSSFKYAPLPTSDSIRILSLLPSPDFSSPLRVHLHTIALSQIDHDIIDHYTALSYVWGDPTLQCPITINNHPFAITASLDSALRSLRDATRTHRIWADAICINENDIPERNAQVAQMDRIYKLAMHTVIHLSSDLTPEREEIFQAAADITQYGIDPNSKDHIDEIINLAETHLLTLPWFRRVWIFQELVLSRDPWVQIGPKRIRWDALCYALLMAKGSPNYSLPQPPGLRILNRMNSSKRGGGAEQFFALLLSRRGLGATDARDVVFAHFGIASDRWAWKQNVPIDYAASVAKVYEEVAVYALRTVGVKELFRGLDDDVEEGGGLKRREGLASWAPDWSQPQSHAVNMYVDNAWNRKKLELQTYLLIIEEPRVLAVLGYDIDVVKDVSLVLPEAKKLKVRPGERTEYQNALTALGALYAKHGGSYASGDENGQYTHITLKGKEEEEEHKRLCRLAWEEWVRIFNEELPSSSSSISPQAIESNSRFINFLKSYILTRSQRKKLFIGGESQGLENQMWLYLYPPDGLPSSLTGRRFASTSKGRIALVPAQARAGDIAMYIPSSDVCYLLRECQSSARVPQERKQELERSIRDEFKGKTPQNMQPTKPYVTSFEELFDREGEDEVPIDYFEMVGECYVEDDVGWASTGEYGHKVFVLA